MPDAMPPTADPTNKLSTVGILSVLAYTLILVALLADMAMHERFSWAVFPLVVAIVGYLASLLKSVSTEKDQKERFKVLALLAWITYYTIAIVWPLPMHWYDGLVVLALFEWPRDTIVLAMLLVYYVASASTHMSKGEVLQVCGRGILAGVCAYELRVNWESKAPARPSPPPAVVEPPPDPPGEPVVRPMNE